jgi:Protein of unknown function (DUF3551)
MELNLAQLNEPFHTFGRSTVPPALYKSRYAASGGSWEALLERGAKVMRKSIYAGLALGAAVIALPPSAQAQTFAWCRHESLNGLRCYWDTWEQCRESEQRGMGGSCFRNPALSRAPETGLARAPSSHPPSFYGRNDIDEPAPAVRASPKRVRHPARYR